MFLSKSNISKDCISLYNSQKSIQLTGDTYTLTLLECMVLMRVCAVHIHAQTYQALITVWSLLDAILISHGLKDDLFVSRGQPACGLINTNYLPFLVECTLRRYTKFIAVFISVYAGYEVNR